MCFDSMLQTLPWAYTSTVRLCVTVRTQAIMHGVISQQNAVLQIACI